jgi:hypothetical protein
LLGWIPRHDKTDALNIDQIPIEMADRSCFYECSPNFLELYDRTKLND